MAYVIKAKIADPRAKWFAFAKARTMYGGRRIAVGDTIYVFASETDGGTGLIAKGVVTRAVAHAKPKGVERWTPRVSIEVRVAARAKRKLGRDELRPFRGTDGPQGELDFKFYRQATNKIGGVSETAAKTLAARF